MRLVVKQETVMDLAHNDDGKITISLMTRTNQQNEKIFYGRFLVPQDKKHLNKDGIYKIESLRTKDQGDAITKAQIRYGQLVNDISQDRILKGRRFEKVFEIFLNEYQEKLESGVEGYSIHMERGYRKTVQNYVLEYLDGEMIDNIRVRHFEDYPEWRMNYWTKNITEKKRRRMQRNKNIRPTPSPRTISWELTMWKRVLKWAKNHSYMNADIPEYAIKKNSNQSRLPFTEEEYTKLTTYLRSNNWLKAEVGKHGKDQRLFRHRSQLREWILFLCGTGIRVGECYNLKWKDITEHTVINDFAIVRFFVIGTHSKVKKRREVIGMPTASEALKRLYKSRVENEFNLPNEDYHKPDDYIFCDVDGSKFGDLREGWHTALEGAGVSFDIEGNRYVPYCCRHWFITDTIRRTNMDASIIAKNCGTSLAMIERYYDSTTSMEHAEEFTKGLPFFLKTDKYGASS